MSERMEHKRLVGDAELAGTQRIIEALSGDRYGIAFTGFDGRTPQVKPLALAAVDAGPYVQGSKETVGSRAYPLARNLYIYVNRDPKTGFDPTVKEFLRFVLAASEGQQAMRDGNNVPLNADLVREQLKKLE